MFIIYVGDEISNTYTICPRSSYSFHIVKRSIQFRQNVMDNHDAI